MQYRENCFTRIERRKKIKHKVYGKIKKIRSTKLLAFHEINPALPAGLSFGVQSCLAMERGAVGGKENQGNGLKQYWLEGKNKSNVRENKREMAQVVSALGFKNEKKN